MHSILFIPFLVLSVYSNLICDGGDLENYPLEKQLNGTWYSSFKEDLEHGCWQSLEQETWWILEYEEFSTTKSLLLIYTPCQNIELVINQQYFLSFDAFYKSPMKDMNFEVTLNSAVVFAYLAKEMDQSHALNLTFTSTETKNKICFSETHGCMENKSCTVFYSGLIDNISLTAVQQPPQTVVSIEYVNVHFKAQCEQIQSLLRLKSNLTYSKELITHFKSSLQVQIQGQIQNEIQFETDENANIIVFFILQRNYDLSKLQISIKNQQMAGKQRIFSVNVSNIQYFFDQLGQQQQQIIKSMKQIIEITAVIFKEFEKVMNTFVITYFILGLIYFRNISLMYYFIMIKTVPVFMRNILKNFIQLSFSGGEIFMWMPQSMQPQSNSLIFTIEDNVGQKMVENRQDYQWFRSYSFSSKIIENNLQIFLSLGLLIIVILLIKLIIKILPGLFQKRIERRCSFLIVAVKQILAMAPLMLISVFTALTNHSDNYHQQFEKIGHNLIVLVIFICYVCLVVPFNETEKEQPSQDSQKLERIHERNERYCEFNEFLLGFSTPILVIIGSPLLLLIVNGVILIYTLIDLAKRFGAIGKVVKIFSTFRLTILFLFHGSYIVFYILLIVPDKTSQIATICGIIVLFCVFIGVVLQLFQSFVKLLLFFIFLFQSIFCSNNNKISNETIQQSPSEIDPKKQQQNQSFNKSIDHIKPQQLVQESIEPNCNNLKNSKKRQKQKKILKISQLLQASPKNRVLISHSKQFKILKIIQSLPEEKSPEYDQPEMLNNSANTRFIKNRNKKQNRKTGIKNRKKQFF